MTEIFRPENLGLASLSIHPKNVKIWNSFWSAQHPNAGQNIQQTLPHMKGIRPSSMAQISAGQKQKGGNLRGKTFGEIQKWSRAPELI